MTTSPFGSAALLELVHDLIPSGSRVRSEDEGLRAAVEALGQTWHTTEDAADVVLLLDGSLAGAGVHASGMVDRAARQCRPGGLIVAAAPSAVYLRLTGRGQDATPALSADDLDHLLRERGVDVELLAGPGAAAHVGGRPYAGRADLALDRSAGLRDAGPVVLAVGRTPPSETDRSRVFYTSIATKIVSASTMCLDDAGRLLIVFDSFKGCWTLPGGLVDRAESPQDAAVRETLEEGGVPVEPGDLLGVFAHDHPDRINLIYGVTPTEAVPSPEPLHTHEIAEARWAPVAEALQLLAPYMARKVRRCLDDPGSTAVL